MVGVERFELPTSCSQSRRATRLRYTPLLSLWRCRQVCVLSASIILIHILSVNGKNTTWSFAHPLSHVTMRGTLYIHAR